MVSSIGTISELVQPGYDRDRLKKLVEKWLGRDPADVEWDEEWVPPMLFNALWIAQCGRLAPDRVLEVLESGDPLDLKRRIQLSDLITQALVPTYSRRELHDGIVSLIERIGRGRDHLLQTGYPQFGLGVDWLDLRLSHLYYVKPWLTADGGTKRDYAWASVVPETTILPSVPGCHLVGAGVPFQKDKDGAWWAGGVRASACSYDDAPYLLEHSVAKDIENRRGSILDLKLEVLPHLSSCLSNGDWQLVWPMVSVFLNRHLRGSDMDFWLDVDRKLGVGYGPGALMSPNHGGLSDLLTVVGHVEQELRFGFWWRVRRLRDFDRLRGPGSYLALSDTERPDLDKALDRLCHHQREHRKCWNAFTRKVRSWLTDTISRGLQIEREIQVALRPPFDEWMGLDSRERPMNEKEPQYVFKRAGDTYQIVFEGESSVLGKSKGLWIIAEMLRHPYKLVSALSLASVDNASTSRERDLAEDGISLSVGTEELISPERLESRIQELHDLDEKLPSLKGRERHAAKSRRDDLEREINEGSGSRTRKASPEQEKSRKSVQAAVRRALVAIGKAKLLKLEEHLLAHLKTGSSLTYSPDTVPKWDL